MKIKVLVVDDNANNLMLEKDLLEAAGFEVFEGINGDEGIAKARQNNPDIIVMDVRLPDMRGTEAALIIRKDAKLREIPIVFVTASVMPEGKAEIDGILNSGFIGKPINTRTFVDDIRRFIK